MKLRPLDKYQKAAMGLMSLMVLLTFALTSLQAALWQVSDLLVGAVLPGVVVDLTNDERDDVDVQPLSRNSALDAAAQLKAEHMAENSYFAHFAPDGTSPWFWFDEADYTYAHAGENLAIHFTDSAEVVEAWMDSPTHRANIVDSKFTEIGVGTARGRYNGHRTVFVVQLFGTPAVVTQPPTLAAAEPEPIASEVPDSLTELETEEEALLDEAIVAAAEIDTASPVPETDTTAPQSATAPAPVSFEPIPVDLTETPEVTPQSEMELVPVTLPESNPATDMLLVRQSMVSTSSGLAAASTETVTPNEPSSVLALATQPNSVLQFSYTLIALAVFFLLVVAFVNEMKHAHPVQMGYSVAMLLLMSGLYWLHTILTEGALVV